MFMTHNYLLQTTNVDGRCCLRSAATCTLLVPSTRRSSLGDRAFPVAASCAWNSLPADVRDAPSLLTFRRRLDVFVPLFIWLTLTAIVCSLSSAASAMVLRYLCKVPLQHFCVKRHSNQYIFNNNNNHHHR